MKKIKSIVICILLLFFSYLAFTIIVKTAPKAESKRPEKQALLVDSFLSEISSEIVTLDLAGSVIPDQEISLKSRINGEIITVSENFIRGGIIKKGELITNENVKSIRPGFGMEPSKLNNILGRKVKRKVFKGDRVSMDFIE